MNRISKTCVSALHDFCAGMFQLGETLTIAIVNAMSRERSVRSLQHEHHG